MITTFKGKNSFSIIYYQCHIFWLEFRHCKMVTKHSFVHNPIQCTKYEECNKDNVTLEQCTANPSYAAAKMCWP